jgi:GT2 family glycosyltransferase
LKSIARRESRVSYEVVVVDNASSDETKKNLSEINNLMVVRNEENMGFIKACNQGAGKARGEYLLFLNNDTQVMPGWLDAIVSILDSDPSVGAVGSKLLYPDGSLQEAGGIIWRDASGWNYGRGDNPEKPEYNFLRDVDYCSGACLAIRKSIFNELGGFDELYFPAYYEDTDLCFGVRKKGYRVVYQPKCKVIHFEGITAGRDTSAGVKAFQAQNKPKFYNKWLTVLSKEHYPPVPSSVWQARVHGKKFHVLIIDHRLPEPDKDSGSVRITALINMYLMLGFAVTFYPDNLEKIEPYTSDFQRMGVEVIYGKCIFKKWLKERREQFHLVHMCRPHTCFNKISIVKSLLPDAKIIYDTVDIHFLREERRAKLENNKEVARQAECFKEMELYLARESGVTFVVTEEERKHLLLLDPDLKVEVVPNIHSVIDNEEIIPFEKRAGLMFLGGYEHTPNVDAVLYFVEEVFPLIRRELPEVEFYVVGSNVTREMEKLKRIDGVRVIGWVPEVEPYFNKVKVFVSPLRYGAGMKGKIGHAMSCGLPVVTTSIGAEGMELIDGGTALIADGAEEFARKVVKLCQSPDLWMKLSTSGIEHIKKRYTPEVVKTRLESILSELLLDFKKSGEA